MAYNAQDLEGAPCLIPFIPGLQPASWWTETTRALESRFACSIRTVFCHRRTRPDRGPDGQQLQGVWALLIKEPHELREGSKTPGGVSIVGSIDAWKPKWWAIHPFEPRVYDLRGGDVHEAMGVFMKYMAWASNEAEAKGAAMERDAIAHFAKAQRSLQADQRARVDDLNPSLLAAEAEATGGHVLDKAEAFRTMERVERLSEQRVLAEANLAARQSQADLQRVNDLEAQFRGAAA